MEGKTLAHYRIVRQLGEGGMGRVYEAFDEVHRRAVALKVISGGADQAARERFVREARNAAALDHPGICAVYEAGEADGQPFLAMELLQGADLTSRLDRCPLDVAELKDLAAQIVAAVAAAHDRHIVHRDIKPANVFVLNDGTVKVVDFGLSIRLAEGGESDTRLTAVGLAVGTLVYMSPEQARAEDLDARSDLFSIGVILYRLATGKLPFVARNQADQLVALLSQVPLPPCRLNPDLPADWERIIYRALQKDPERRYQSAAELLADIQRAPVPASRSALTDNDITLTAVTPLERGLVPRRDRRAPIIGREQERTELLTLLGEASRGDGAIAFVTGEAGIGKSSLMAALESDALTNGLQPLIGRCFEAAGTPNYAPFVEILETVARHLSPAELARLLGPGAAYVARIVPYLRLVLSDLGESPPLPPDAERQVLFGALADCLARAAAERPLVLILEDLHWADDATLAFLHYLSDRVSAVPMLVVGTYRDLELDQVPALGALLDRLQHEGRHHALALGQLGAASVATLLASLAGAPPPAKVADDFFRRTGGNPLFAERLYLHLAAEGQLFDRLGRWRASLRLVEGTVPKSIHEVLSTRLRRVDEGVRAVLAAAAVVGRGEQGFRVRVLEEMAVAPETELFDAIDDAERAHIVSTAMVDGEVVGTYSHALIRDVLLAELKPLRRQRLHMAAAQALETIHRDRLEPHAEDLAHHLLNAGNRADASKTVRYLQIAARQAQVASAYEESVRLCRLAIERLEQLPAGEDRDLCELELRSELVNPLSSLEGYMSDAVAQVYEEVRQVCRRVGKTPPLLLSNLWRFYFLRGQLDVADRLAERMLTAATSVGQDPDDALLYAAHRALASDRLWRGEIVDARRYIELAIDDYHRSPDGCAAIDEIDDALTFCLYTHAFTLWFLGEPDRALARVDEAFARAKELGHPVSIAASLLFRGFVHQSRGEIDATLAATEVSMRHAGEHGLLLWQAPANIFHGWALVHGGNVDEGIGEIRSGTAAWQAAGGGLATTYYSVLEAEALILAGRPEEALKTLAQAEADMEARSERLHEAEIHRLRGEALIRQDPAGSGAIARAEECVRKAIAVAHAQGSLSLELRAAISLHRILADAGRADEALPLLVEACRAFDEGLDSKDLRTARELLNGR